MTEKHKKMFALLAAAAISCALGGCGEEKPEYISREEFMATLPSVTAFSVEAERLRAEQTETDTLLDEAADGELEPDKREEGTEIPFDDEPEDETWKEGLAFPEAARTDEEETAGTPEIGENSGDKNDITPLAQTAPAEPRETAPAETIEASQTIAVSPATAENTTLGTSGTLSAPSQEYDKEFFASDLFIGDSISTGYSLYGFMDEKNVFAKIGLNPSSALTKNVSTVYGEIGVTDMISITAPKRVYIMLGSNGIQWLSTDSMLRSMRSLTEMISLTSPETQIVIVGVPPVTAAYDSTVDGLDVMTAVNEYNSGLSRFAAECGFIYVDPGEILKDSTGYFSGTYAESDGMHFKSSTYKILLSFIQSKVTSAEQAAAAQAAAEEEAAMAAVSGQTDEESGSIDIAEFAEKIGIDDTIKNAVTALPAELVTIPEESVPDDTAAETGAAETTVETRSPETAENTMPVSENPEDEPDVWSVSGEKIKE